MKKIVTSVGMIVFVAAIVAGGTGAFFSDTETSTGNTFTAGAIDLTVDSEAHYNGMICVPNPSQTVGDYYWQPEVGTVAPYYPALGSPCFGTWEATNLGAQTFFNYTDVKPGDEGENTISLHVNSNPAWACVDVSLTKNDDMTVNEPEDAEILELDTPLTEPDGDLFDGELAQNMKFAAWLDQGNTPGWQGKRVNGEVPTGDVGEGDNIWQGDETEPLLFSNQSGPASDVLGGKSYTLAAPNVNGGAPMTPNQTNYIGLQWCAGTQVVNTTLNTITCDGSTLGNIVQTDSMVANIAFRVEQSRNNENFLCSPRVAPQTATVNVDKEITFTNILIEGVTVSDFALTIDGPGAPIAVVDNVPTAGLPVGTYSISEVYSGVPANVTFNASFSGGCTEVGDTGVGTMNVVAGVNPTCVITNAVSLV